MIRVFLGQTAQARGRGGAKNARSMLRKVFDLAMESSALHVTTNPVLAARAAVPDVKVRHDGLDHQRAPDDDEVEAFLAALRADPLAQPMTAGKRPQGQAWRGRHGVAEREGCRGHRSAVVPHG
jgi:hypothetical protein